MASPEPANMELPESDSEYEALTLGYTMVPKLPLHPYHMEQHQRAGVLICAIFMARHEPTAADELCKLQQKLSTVNQDIYQYNIDHCINIKLGIIDIGVFLHAWEKGASTTQLEHFCRLHNYPVEWACLPPAPGAEYCPYRPDYWSSSDWVTPGFILKCLWSLRMVNSPESTIEDIEGVLISVGSDFNRNVNRLHKIHQHPRPWVNVGFLEMDTLLSLYQELGTYAFTEHIGHIVRCREKLRRECMLNGYPETWVPDYGADLEEAED
ncbi:uncharacterized protein KD926_008958 [Aspergillus affinis]|uniref:uncharacterized protein n=1 Tax=Aspergillus affinis TaxID=1070780 RepID=UPI0022FE1B64|nr:uncharacterized protein KD926_008958 [Aspergillus affinis]KAI9039857.1 hypothetical protein KD926_008958 [Aspergillus affinis]